MSKLPVISGFAVVKAFSRLGFTKARQTGILVIMVKHGMDFTLPIPFHYLMKLGAFRTKYQITIYTCLVSDRDIGQITTKTIGISNDCAL